MNVVSEHEFKRDYHCRLWFEERLYLLNRDMYIHLFLWRADQIRGDDLEEQEGGGQEYIVYYAYY